VLRGKTDQRALRALRLVPVVLIVVLVAISPLRADVGESLEYMPRAEREAVVQGLPTRSPYQDLQATSRPVGEPTTRPYFETTVPAEVLDDADDDLVLRHRPTFASLTQEDIFSLRDGRTFDADFVRLSFDPEQLSAVQMDILLEWLRGGHNRIMLMGREIRRYGPLMGARPAYFLSDNNGTPRALTLDMDSPVSVDCRDVRIPFDWRKYILSRRWVWEGINPKHTKDAVVLAYYRDEKNMAPRPKDEKKPCCLCCCCKKDCKGCRVAAYGMFPVGKTQVYFRPFYLAEGGDGARFELNWVHWVMQRPTPPSALPVTIPPAAMPTTEGDEVSPAAEPDDVQEPSAARPTTQPAETEQAAVTGAEQPATQPAGDEASAPQVIQGWMPEKD